MWILIQSPGLASTLQHPGHPCATTNAPWCQKYAIRNQTKYVLMPISTLIDMPYPKAAMQGQLQLLSSLVYITHISSYQDIFDNCNVADQVMLTYTLVSF